MPTTPISPSMMRAVMMHGYNLALREINRAMRHHKLPNVAHHQVMADVLEVSESLINEQVQCFTGEAATECQTQSP